MIEEQKISGSQFVTDSSTESLNQLIHDFLLFLKKLDLNTEEIDAWEKSLKEAFQNLSGTNTVSWILRGNQIFLEIFTSSNTKKEGFSTEIVKNTHGTRKVISKSYKKIDKKNSTQNTIYDLEIASEFQKKILPLPQLPENEQWSLFTRRKSSLNVAGDYADAYQNKNGDLFLIAADVMGKGMAAAFLATMIHTAFDINLESNVNLLDLINALNRTIIREAKNLTIFATCSVAFIPKSCERIDIVNAAHCPPLLFNKNQLVHEFLPSGPPLGIFENSHYTTESLPLTKDLQLIMLTDGLYEWKRKDNTWGWKNLLKFIPKHLSSPEDLWNALQKKIDECSSPEAPGDDQTLLFWTQKK